MEQALRYALAHTQFSPGEQRLEQSLAGYYDKCLRYYENPTHYEEVRQVIPQEEIRARAGEWLDDASKIWKCDAPGEQKQEALVCSLMHWFKHDFFRWMNSPSCSFCSVGIPCCLYE